MFVTIQLNIVHGTFEMETNIERENVNKFLIEFLKTDIGHGEDPREYVPKEEYKISIYKDGNGDFETEDNCENKDLRRGILGIFIRDYKYMLKQLEADDARSLEELYGFVASG